MATWTSQVERPALGGRTWEDPSSAAEEFTHVRPMAVSRKPPSGSADKTVGKKDDGALSPINPDLVRTSAEFVKAMNELKVWSGLSLRKLSERAGPGVLAHSSLGDALNSKKLPDLVLLRAFLRAVGLKESEVHRWDARCRILAVEQLTPPKAELPPTAWSKFREVLTWMVSFVKQDLEVTALVLVSVIAGVVLFMTREAESIHYIQTALPSLAVAPLFVVWRKYNRRMSSRVKYVRSDSSEVRLVRKEEDLQV